MIDKNLKEKVISKQCYNGREIEFDPDSSPLAWKYYFLYFDGDEAFLKLKGKRLVLKKNDFDIGGDTSFNFNEKNEYILKLY